MKELETRLVARLKITAPWLSEAEGRAWFATQKISAEMAEIVSRFVSEDGALDYWELDGKVGNGDISVAAFNAVARLFEPPKPESVLAAEAAKAEEARARREREQIERTASMRGGNVGRFGPESGHFVD